MNAVFPYLAYALAHSTDSQWKHARLTVSERALVSAKVRTEMASYDSLAFNGGQRSSAAESLVPLLPHHTQR